MALSVLIIFRASIYMASSFLKTINWGAVFKTLHLWIKYFNMRSKQFTTKSKLLSSKWTPNFNMSQVIDGKIDILCLIQLHTSVQNDLYFLIINISKTTWNLYSKLFLLTFLLHMILVEQKIFVLAISINWKSYI